MIAIEVTPSGQRGKLQELQRICKEGGGALATSVVRAIEPACDVIKAKRKEMRGKRNVTRMRRQRMSGPVFYAVQCAKSQKLQRKKAAFLRRQLANARVSFKKFDRKKGQKKIDL